MPAVYQLIKLAALASLAGMIATHWLSPFDSATVGVTALYLLFVRVG